MRASGIPYCFLLTSLVSLLLAATGCTGSQSDRTVRVSQAPAPAAGPAQPVPSRLAGGSAESEANSGTSSAMPVEATASMDDSGGAVRQVSGSEPLGMIGSEEGVDEDQLMEAFRHADPQVREMAERQVRAVAGAPSTQAPAEQPSADPEPGNRAASQQGMLASSDAASDQGVPTLPGSEQRVADAQPKTADIQAKSRAGNGEPTDQAPQADPPAGQTTLDSRDSELAKSFARVDRKAKSAQDSPDAEQTDATSDAEDEPEIATFEEQFATLDEKRLLEALIARYAEGEEEESEAAGLRRRINHRLLLTMAGRIDEAVEPLEGLASSEQEYLRHQILTLWTAIDPQGHPVSQRRWTSALPHLREATSYLAAATGKLDVRSLAFCTEVVSFGRVKPFEVNRFTAGQEVILYSEIDCFAAERLSDGYETHFNGSFEILDASGKRVADKVLPSDRQSGKNYRRDYFIAYRMHLPGHLDPGNYRMELTIEDLKGKKYGSSSIAFAIEGSGRAE